MARLTDPWTRSGVAIESAEALRRLDPLVDRLLLAKFKSPSDGWKFQSELLAVQRDIQVSIGSAKRDRSAGDELRELRRARWHARRLGDAFAWIVLGFDRKFIYPLGCNDPVAIPLDAHSHRGVEVSAMSASERWGFPILHDITDCLRIGDVTFVLPGDVRSTIEVKTQVLSEEKEPDGRVRLEYQVHIAAMAQPPQLRFAGQSLPTERADSLANHADEPSGVASRPARRIDERFERQLRRLNVARQHQDAPVGSVREIDGTRVVTTAVDGSAWAENADVLQRVVRRARRNGYACEPVDDTFLYGAFYDADGLEIDRLHLLMESLPRDLVDSGVLINDEPSRNSLGLYTIPAEPHRGPQQYLPYYLLPIPRTAVHDILHGRMILFNLVNVGRIAEALEAEGFVVRQDGSGGAPPNGSMVIEMEVETARGARYAAEYHNPELHLTEMAMEFLPLRYLVDVILGSQSGLALGINLLNEERCG
jgi:hypothetical protein